MKTIVWHLETSTNGCDFEGELEVEDDATEEIIEHHVKEEMWNFLSLTWKEKGKDDE